MFVDLVGSTALSRAARSRGHARVLRAYQDCGGAARSPASRATSRSSWATACWPISAGPGARGRGRAGGPGRPRDRRGRRPAARAAGERAGGAGRHRHRAWSWWATSSARARPRRRRSSARRPTSPLGCRRWPQPGQRGGRRSARGGCSAALFELEDLGAAARSRALPSRSGLAGPAASARPRAASRRCRRGADAAGRPRAGAGAAARALGAGQGRRGPGRAALGRARHRQVAARARACASGSRDEPHVRAALSVLALSQPAARSGR